MAENQERKSRLVLNPIFRDETLSAVQTIILLNLMSRRKPGTNIASVSQCLLSQVTGFSRQWVNVTLKRLEKRGLIKSRPWLGGDLRCKEYEILIDPFFASFE